MVRLDCCDQGTCSSLVTGNGTPVTSMDDVTNVIGSTILEFEWIETNYIWRDKRGMGLAGFLFDYEPRMTATWDMTHWLVMKKRIGEMGSGSVYIGEREGCCAAIWKEGTVRPDSTTVAVTAPAWATQIEFTNLSDIGWVGSQVSLKIRGDRMYEVVVDSIDPSNPNIAILCAALTEEIAEWACVERGIYTPIASCDAELSNQVTSPDSVTEEHYSIFRDLVITLEYNDQCIINQTYLIDMCKGNKDQKETAIYRILQDNYQEQFNNAMREFRYSIYYDKNTCGNSKTGKETMGLFPAMAKEHNRAGWKAQFFDLSACCDPDDCERNKKMLLALLKIVRDRTRLNVYGDTKRVIFGINRDFEEALLNMRPYIEMEMGATLTKQYGDESTMDIISTRQHMFMVEDRGYDIIFLPEPEFEGMGVADNNGLKSFALMMPENTMGIYQMPYSHVDVNGSGIALAGRKEIMTWGNGLKFNYAMDDRTAAQKLFGCSKHIFHMQYAVIWKYVDKCAYAGISWFGCDDDDLCIDCTTQADPANVPFVSNY